MSRFARRLFQAAASIDSGLVGGYPKPDGTNTGPRYAITQTLTSAQATTILDSTGYLSRAYITGGITLSSGWVIEDCIISGTSLYMVNGFTSGAAPLERPIIRYCEVNGGAGTSAVFYVGHTVIEWCHVYCGIDIFKLTSGVIVRHCYGHGMYRTVDSHNDVVQIVAGQDMLVEWNNFVGVSEFGLSEGAPVNGNSVLQTGTIVGDLSQIYWYDNWVDGGGYTLGGVSEDRLGGFTIQDYVFRRNKHGRNYSFGPTVYLFPPGTTGFAWYYDDNVWEDNGLSVSG